MSLFQELSVVSPVSRAPRSSLPRPPGLPLLRSRSCHLSDQRSRDQEPISPAAMHRAGLGGNSRTRWRSQRDSSLRSTDRGPSEESPVEPEQEERSTDRSHTARSF